MARSKQQQFCNTCTQMNTFVSGWKETKGHVLFSILVIVVAGECVWGGVHLSFTAKKKDIGSKKKGSCCVMYNNITLALSESICLWTCGCVYRCMCILGCRGTFGQQEAALFCSHVATAVSQLPFSFDCLHGTERGSRRATDKAADRHSPREQAEQRHILKDMFISRHKARRSEICLWWSLEGL